MNCKYIKIKIVNIFKMISKQIIAQSAPNFELMRQNHEKQMLKTNKLSDKKAKLYRKLDKQIYTVFSKCENNIESVYCKMKWKQVYNSLNELNEINKELNLHSLFIHNIIQIDI